MYPAVEPLEAGVSVVVPVYRGQGTIESLYRQLAVELERGDRAWELIFVDDCSPDESWAVVQRMVAEDQHVVGVQLSRNFGQHAALLAGVRAARYSVTVTMDDDLQHRPDTVHVLLDALNDGVDLVYGDAEEEEHSAWRNLTSRLGKFVLASSIGAEMARRASAFRAFRTALRAGWVSGSDPFVSLDVLLSWVTTRYSAVSVPMDVRTVGTSNYDLRRLMKHMLNMLTGYSTRPLRIATWLGFLASFFGLCTLVYVLVVHLFASRSVPGFAFLASLVSMLAGVQLFSIGVIGEYLGRVHVRSTVRPTYLVRQVARSGAADPP